MGETGSRAADAVSINDFIACVVFASPTWEERPSSPPRYGGVMAASLQEVRYQREKLNQWSLAS